MFEDIIDTVLADTVEIGDYIKEGQITDIQDDGSDGLFFYTDNEDEYSAFYRWDDTVDLYGNEVEVI